MHEDRDTSASYERPPVVPQRSSFEVTAAASGAVRQTNSMSSNSGLLGPTGANPSNTSNSNFFVASASPSSPQSTTSPSPPGTAPTPPNLGLGGAVDREVFVAARAAVHNAPRPVLAALLTSILDDHPALAPIIKHRYERAISAVATQQQMMAQQQIPPTGAYWSGMPQQQPPVTSSGSNSPSRKRSFRGRGGHEEEQQVCGVHGAVRSIKHLRIADGGIFECVPGFHCLETSKDNSNCVSPTKGERELSHVHSSLHAAPFVPQQRASFSNPSTPPPNGMDHFVVQGLFQPSASGSSLQHPMHHGHGHGHGMMPRQNTQPPNAPLPSMLSAVSGGYGGGFAAAQPSSASNDDDNLEELLKSLHLASSQQL